MEKITNIKNLRDYLVNELNMINEKSNLDELTVKSRLCANIIRTAQIELEYNKISENKNIEFLNVNK